MGYPQPTLKVVVGGKLSNDVWRTGIDFGLNIATAPTSGQLNALITSSIQPAFLVWWNALKGFNTTAADYSYLQAYYYPQGSTAAAAVGTSTLSAVPGTGGNALPLRTCLVASKMTAYAGRHNRGRMYIPYTAATTSLTADGQTITGVVNSYATATATLFQTLNAASWTSAGITSQSAVVTSSNAPAVAHSVINIRVDSLPDSQRRRTNKDAPAITSNSAV